MATRIPSDRVDAPSSAGSRLPRPEPGRWAAQEYVARHLGHLIERRYRADQPQSSAIFRGGQAAADAALARFDVTDFLRRNGNAYPQPTRATSALSPWIRHGLLTLGRVWDAVTDGPPDDVDAFRNHLLWQEYARHRYARLGALTALAIDAVEWGETPVRRPGDWSRHLGCVELCLDELEEDGWLVGAGRRWLASQWSRNEGRSPRGGEEYFFVHLLDGSRAANRLGWEQAIQTPFSRWDVEAKAPGLCASCDRARDCPIERPAPPLTPAASGAETGDPDYRLARLRSLLAADPDLVDTTGPTEPMPPDGTARDTAPDTVDAVWITAESMGDADPALSAHPGLPAVFVFDEPLLHRLRLSSTRLVFLVETLAELAATRPVEVHLGDPVDVLAGRRLAVTFAPVPGWRRRAARLDVAAAHPWPWLRRPHAGPIATFEEWHDGLT